MLHSVNRMTKKQAVDFLEQKLRASIDMDVFNNVAKHFDLNGLVDMKRLIFSAMRLEEEGILGKDQTLNNGGAG